MRRVTATVFLFTSALLLAWPIVGVHAQSDTSTASLKFVRADRLVAALCRMYVIVNGESIGYASNGETKYFDVSIRPGKNRIYLKVTDFLGFETLSESLDIECYAGGTIIVESGNFAARDGKGVIEFTASAAKPTPKLISVQLDKKLKKEIIKETEGFRLARGTSKTVEDSLKITHSVTITKGKGSDYEGKLKIGPDWLGVEGGIRSSISEATSKTFGLESEVKRSVTVTGDGSSGKVKVLWVIYYRTGIATVKVDGKETKIPFEFKEDFGLLTEEAD